MTRQLKISVILLIFLTGLIGVYFWISSIPTEKEVPEAVKETVTIFKTDKEELVEISKKTSDFEYSLIKKDSEWKVSSNDLIKLDASNVLITVSDFSLITAESKVSDNASSLEEYGFSEPTGTISIKTSDGTQENFFIGSKTPSQSSYYFMKENDPAVYTIYATKAESLLAPLTSLRDKTLHLMESEDITSFSLTKKDGEKISLKRKSQEIIDELSQNNPYASTWVMSSPYNLDVNDLVLGESILSKIPSIFIKDFKDDTLSDLNKYGLNTPSYVIEFSNNDNKTIKLLIGNKIDNAHYAMLDGQPSVFTVDSSSITFKDVSALELIIKTIFSPNISTVRSIEVNYRDEKYLLEPTEKEDGSYDCKINNKQSNEAEFKKAYGGIIGLSIYGMVTTPSSDNPDFVITFKFNNDAFDKVIKLFPHGERFYDLSIDGKFEYQITKQEAMDMLELIRALDKNSVKQ